MSYCAPINVFESEQISCYSLDDLKVLATAYNKWIISKGTKKSLIDLNNIDKKELLEIIKKKLYNKCKTEYCWLNLEFINLIPDKSIIDKLKKSTFKPISPRGKYTWLNTYDINNIMIQYNILFPKYEYLGALPCDFYKYIALNLDDFLKYECVSAILNLDKSNQKGSHWVSLFIDNVNGSIEYFDSLAKHPNKCIKTFIDKIRIKYPNYVYLENTIQHQFKNSECGVYSIYFTLSRLYGTPFDELSRNIIADDTMNFFRQFLFRPRK
jgi:hypothetical protein